MHERRLRDSLEAEREAVLDFMYTTVDSVSPPSKMLNACDLHVDTRVSENGEAEWIAQRISTHTI